MKNLYISLFLLVVGTNVSLAQTTKGHQFLGLTLSAGTQKAESGGSYQSDSKIESFSLIPEYSYFFADQWELGGRLGYSYSHLDQSYKFTDLMSAEMSIKQKSNGIVSGLFLRRHLMLTEKIGFRTGPFFSFAYEKTKYNDDLNLPDADSKNLFTGINLGIEFFPVNRLGVASELGAISYQYIKMSGSPEVSRKTTAFNAALTSQLNLSVFYIF